MIGAALVLTACGNTNDGAMDQTPPPEPARDTTPPPPPPQQPTVSPVTQIYLDEHVLPGENASLVYFGFDRYDVDADARRILQAQADWMKANPSVSIIVEGHCDERGTREYNIALGDRRANAVKNYLVAMGVSASRVRTVSYGKERPVDMSNHDRNRRGKTRVN